MYNFTSGLCAKPHQQYHLFLIGLLGSSYSLYVADLI